MSGSHTKIIVGTAVTIGTLTAAGLAYLYSKKNDEPIPNKWRKIGEITDLNCFLVGACAPIQGNSFDCEKLGIEYKGLFDRCFIVTRNNKQVLGQTYPKMVLIQPKVQENFLILSAPGRSDFELNLDDLRKKTEKEIIECKHIKAIAIDAGDPVAEWISEYISGEPGEFRLKFYPLTYPTKGIPARDKQYKDLRDQDAGSYHGKSSYMMINKATVEDLNTHLDHTVKPLQFRPNFVVDGPAPHDEDHWKWVRVGDSVIFRVVRPCTRCTFTTVNPDTGERNAKNEPMRTLTKTKEFFLNGFPVMGIQLGLRAGGKVYIGDSVCINDGT